MATKAQKVAPVKPGGPVPGPDIGADKKTGTKDAAQREAEAAPTVAKRGAGPQDAVVDVEIICGGITKVKVPVAIGRRYEGLAFAGPTKEFDRQLDSWLTRALELGMIGSGLGQLFPVNLQGDGRPGR
jgi:hypothetical protein